MGIVNLAFGGEAGRAERREYGPAELIIDDDSDLFYGLRRGESTRVWMSHGDKMTVFPKDWTVLAHSANSPIAAFADPTRRFFGVQFHPEVGHTPRGREVLDNFVFRVCRLPARLDDGTLYRNSVEEIREQVGDGRVLCALAAASILRWRRPWCTGRSKIGSSASSSITACCARTKRSKSAACLSSGSGELSLCGCQRRISRRIERRRRSGDQTQAHRLQVYRRLRKRSAQARRDRLSRPRHALSRCYRIGIGARTFGDDQIASQRRRPADHMNFKLIEPLRELFKDEVRRFRQTTRLAE